MRHTKVLAIAFAASLLAVGCTKAETPGSAAAKPVAVVNGTPISKEVWELYVKASHQNKTVADLTEEERKKALDELVGMYVGAQEAEKQNLGVGEPEARLELVRMSALAELLYKKVVEGAAPTDAELKAEYDERIAELPPLEFHARHILVADEAKAKDMIAQLGKGANFEQLAKDNSTDGSSTEGGDLSWFSPQQMVKPFSDAVKQLEVGQVHDRPGAVRVRLARHQARRHAADHAAAIRRGKGPDRADGEPEEVREAPRRSRRQGESREDGAAHEPEQPKQPEAAKTP